jgi:hypothetical protein
VIQSFFQHISMYFWAFCVCWWHNIYASSFYWIYNYICSWCWDVQVSNIGSTSLIRVLHQRDSSCLFPNLQLCFLGTVKQLWPNIFANWSWWFVLCYVSQVCTRDDYIYDILFRSTSKKSDKPGQVAKVQQ